MYPITRERLMAAISSNVAEKAVCWWDGRKKRSKRILRRLTHSAVDESADHGETRGPALTSNVYRNPYISSPAIGPVRVRTMSFYLSVRFARRLRWTSVEA